MILPVPHPRSAVAINLEGYKTIFDDCDRSFYKPATRSLNFSFAANSGSDTDTLAVIDVGSYKVSMAHTLDDLARVNTNVFVLSPGCKEVLQQHYSQPYWGFIICKLAKGREHYHPFAYEHDLIAQGHLFIPTRHFHHDPMGSMGSMGSMGILFSYPSFGYL